ncbi:MAG TPA: septal ring lytic transglycosylase RlpA family protein [Thermoanaerobaculia bacterium]|nr:septal ring lytic transglycosylase RlpA family protein [Thermoanaerobaculia bacterium]
MDHTALPTRDICKPDARRPDTDIGTAPPGEALSRLLLQPSLLLLLLLLPLLTTGCSTTHPRLRPSDATVGNAFEHGMASWYGPGFDGRRTASGEHYKRTALTAAHRTLPFGTRVQVKNLENGSTVVVRINDRGPFARGRVIDLSYQAAHELGVDAAGTAQVELAILGAELPAMRYTVQVGAYSDPDYAVLLHRDLKRLYPEAFVHSDGIWNRVQVGLFTDRENAEDLRRELAAMGISSIVVAAR